MQVAAILGFGDNLGSSAKGRWRFPVADPMRFTNSASSLLAVDGAAMC